MRTEDANLHAIVDANLSAIRLQQSRIQVVSIRRSPKPETATGLEHEPALGGEDPSLDDREQEALNRPSRNPEVVSELLLRREHPAPVERVVPPDEVINEALLCARERPVLGGLLDRPETVIPPLAERVARSALCLA